METRNDTAYNQVAIELLRHDKPVDIAYLAMKTGLSLPDIQSVLQHYFSSGFVEFTDQDEKVLLSKKAREVA